MEHVKIEGVEMEGVWKRVSSHTHIDMLHRSSKYCTQYKSNLEVGFSRFLQSLSWSHETSKWQDFSTLQKYINIYYTITNVMHYRIHHKE